MFMARRLLFGATLICLAATSSRAGDLRDCANHTVQLPLTHVRRIAAPVLSVWQLWFTSTVEWRGVLPGHALVVERSSADPLCRVEAYLARMWFALSPSLPSLQPGGLFCSPQQATCVDASTSKDNVTRPGCVVAAPYSAFVALRLPVGYGSKVLLNGTMDGSTELCARVAFDHRYLLRFVAGATLFWLASVWQGAPRCVALRCAHPRSVQPSYSASVVCHPS